MTLLLRSPEAVQNGARICNSRNRRRRYQAIPRYYDGLRTLVGRFCSLYK